MPSASYSGLPVRSCHSPSRPAGSASPAVTPWRKAVRSRAPRAQYFRIWRYSVDRKSVVSGKSVSVRVDLGGRRIMKKKTLWMTRVEHNVNITAEPRQLQIHLHNSKLPVAYT